MGPMPQHQTRTRNGLAQIRFEKSVGKWGKWIKIGAKNITIFGGGVTRGTGGGGLATVETDNTIEGDGSEAAPLHLYGVVNSVIVDPVTVLDGQVMINNEIVIDESNGGSLDIEPGGELILLQTVA